MKKLLLSAIVLAVVASACATGAPTATPTPAGVLEVPLAPFSDQHFGLEGVRPESWTETEPGIFVEEVRPPYLPQLLIGAYPGLTAEWAYIHYARQLGLDRLPESTGAYESPYLAWQLMVFEADHPEMGQITVDGALAETESALYVVAVLAERDEYESLHEAVLLPVLETLAPLEVKQRDVLTQSDLMADDHEQESPVNNTYLTPIGVVGPPLHHIEGLLTVPQFQMHASDSQAGSQSLFPGFSVEFFTYEEYLVPAQRDIVPASDGDSFWSVILSPGKLWSEANDGGLSRASFPFLLVAQDSNESHNGMATFVYDDRSVSSFYVQVAQETAAWNQRDFWGQSPMLYSLGHIENSDELKAKFERELSLQTPIRPWSDLAERLDPALLAPFNDRFHPWSISASGLILDGTIYLQPCLTRYGEYPYCRYMRHGVFSVTKSMAAAVALLRLAQKYGEDVFDLRIADYVEVTADHDGWEEVTFGDALNMATGIGDDPSLQVMTAEEDEPKFYRFMEARSAQDKLQVCFSYGNYPWGPGEVARYNSINTFVLSVAMTNFLRSREGPDADIWDMVLQEVYKPIGILHAPIMRTHEPDGSQGVPIFGYGLYPTVDDVAKVAALLHSGGEFEGQQLLHAGKLAEALYQTDDPGLPTGDSNEYGNAMYHLSFWSMPYRITSGDFYQIPYMSGFGGNHVALIPNGITAFRFADAHIYGIDSMVRVAEGIRPWDN
jgi:CubicO group peptidase (beta-lactamase class C family)